MRKLLLFTLVLHFLQCIKPPLYNFFLLQAVDEETSMSRKYTAGTSKAGPAEEASSRGK